MKIVFIGDIHGRDVWKKIIEKEVFDLVIFAGDYVSTHEEITGEKQIENLKEILTYKEENPNKVILLRGNHDLQHLGYSWAECSGFFYKVQDWLSFPENKERFLQDTQWVYIYKNIIFSHAGISNTWFESLKIKDLNKINEMLPSPIFGFTPGSLSDFSGTSITQPCVWIRPSALLRDLLPKYTQVIGHTTMNTIVCYPKGVNNILEKVWICDTLPFEYLVFENDTFTPKYVDKPVIRLYNRYEDLVYLSKINDDEWKLEGDDNIFKYMSIAYNKDHILSIDPSGGPYLAENDFIGNYRITSIKQRGNADYILTLKYEVDKN